MKRFFPIYAMFFLLACNSKPAVETVTAAERVRTGATAPDFTLEGTDGKSVSLKDYRGKIVLLDFWATWCPPCRLSTPALVKLQKKYKDKNVAVLGISLDEDRKAVPPYILKENVEHAVLYGGNSSVGETYRVRAIPAFYLIDASGTVVRSYSGYAEDFPEVWEKDIALLLAKKAP